MNTYAPPDILAIRTAYQRRTGLPDNAIGIVGDARHRKTGGYHEGRSDLEAAFGPDMRHADGRRDYSVRQPRDLAGLTDAASAIDFGYWTGLHDFSVRLAHACATGDPRTAAVRQFIYSADGRTVTQWDAIGEQHGGDSSHLTHSHLSLFRDTEGKPERVALLGLVEQLLSGYPDVAPVPVAPPWPGRYLMIARPYMRGADVRTWQTRMVQRRWSLGEHGIDGVYGPDTAKVCRQFQQEKGLQVDGIVGPVTWAAAWTAPWTPE